jgi:thiamine-phosphate pyrophosphorylase
MSIRFPRGLYGVTPDWADTDRLLGAIEAAHEGGMAAVQWRRKHGERADLLAQLAQVQALCHRLGLLLIINDDWRLAADINADGVHMGRDDGSIAQARLALGSEKIIGASCYNDLARAAEMLRQDVDYIAFGALHPSRVKPEAVRVTPDQIRQARILTRELEPRPAVVVIGGITPDNAPAAVDAGADSIAVISALFEAPDIRLAAHRCAALFT